MNRPKSNSSTYLIAGMMMLVVGAAVVLVMNQFSPKTTIYLGNGVYDAQIANTPAEREKGLSGVTQLGPRDALLFVFPSDDTWGIWMKDMKIPIDIVWLDNDKKVVYSVKNASPDDSTNVTFNPVSAARYIVELPAGVIDSKNIRTGRTAVFDIALEEVK